MTRELIVQILQSEGAKASGGGFAIGEDRDATCFISTPGEVLPVGRVVHVECKDQLVVLETAKAERFLFAYADVLGFRLALPSGGRERGAGFR